MILKRYYSYVGKCPISVEKAVTFNFSSNLEPMATPFGHTEIQKIIEVSGPLGLLKFPLHKGLQCKFKKSPSGDDSSILNVELDKQSYESMNQYQKRFTRAMWGTTTSILRNHVEGVLEGFQVVLKLVGVGYKASFEGNNVDLKVGYSHPLLIHVPSDITVTIPTPTKIVLKGTDFQKVKQFAAFIRSKRKPEPYKGKGIFIDDETIKLKEGKKK